MSDFLEIVTDNQFCGNCIFFDASSSTELGRCHRYPPQTILHPDSEILGTMTLEFPAMQINEWCGEFRRKKE